MMGTDRPETVPNVRGENAGTAGNRPREMEQSDTQLVVLTLGMVWSSEKQVKELERSSPAWRDYNRLTSLQKVLPKAEIHSVTHNNHSLLTVKTSHNLNIGRRGASTLHWKLREGLQFNVVLCDYFRFPCEYMREAYEGLLTFLQELQSKGRIASGLKLFLPNLQLLKIFKEEQLTASFRSIHHLDLEETRQLHPLYLATDKLEKELDGVNRFLSGYCNETELKQLDPEFPFVVCSEWIDASSEKSNVTNSSSSELRAAYNRALELRRRTIRESKGLKVKCVVRPKKSKTRSHAPRHEKSQAYVSSCKRKRCSIPEPTEFFTIVERSAANFSKRLMDGRYKKSKQLEDVLCSIFSTPCGQQIDIKVLQKLAGALKALPTLRAHMLKLFPRMNKRSTEQKVEFIRSYLAEINSRYPPDSEVNKSFISVLSQYKNGLIQTDVVLKRVALLFQGDEDLLLGFVSISDEQVIHHTEQLVLSCLSDTVASKSKRRSRRRNDTESKEAEVLLKIKDQVDVDTWRDLVKCLEVFNQGLLSPVELGSLLEEALPSSLLEQVNLLIASSIRVQQKQPFTSEEDLVLLDAVCGSIAESTLQNIVSTVEGTRHPLPEPPNWKDIAKRIQTRTEQECRLRWEEHVDPSINRGLWTVSEDMKLLGLYIEGCRNVNVLRTKMAGRTCRQIEARLEVIRELHKCLKPRSDSARSTAISCALSTPTVLPSYEDIPVIPREALIEIVELLRHPAELEQFLSHFHLDLQLLSHALEANFRRRMKVTTCTRNAITTSGQMTDI